MLSACVTTVARLGCFPLYCVCLVCHLLEWTALASVLGIRR
uniref:Uncharacterized protein n=1 Tax=Anguilla anguilla TaxID=7936 RepID=A0A0E9Q0C7_ANGAN